MSPIIAVDSRARELAEHAVDRLDLDPDVDDYRAQRDAMIDELATLLQCVVNDAIEAYRVERPKA